MGPTPAVAAVRRAVRTTLADLRPAAGRDPRPLVLVACSGGADSLALAAALAFEAGKLGVRGGGVTVDHGLQRDSADQAATVATILTALGLEPVGVVRASVGTEGGPEAAARSARYAALGTFAAGTGAAAVLLGHTLDDQAETVLLGLARGSGARSLAGMPARTGLYRRPLLELSRTTVAKACADAGLVPWDDPHNADPAYTRVRVRRRALPVLEETLGPGIADALARSARLLRDDADALDAWAARAYDECLGTDGDLRLGPLEGLPAAVRRRVLRQAARSAGCRSTDLSARHLDELDRLITAWRGQGPLELPSHILATRSNGRISLRSARLGGEEPR